MAKPTTTRKTRTPAPVGETKSQKFSRLASVRVSKALKQIRNIGNLSGNGYEYTPEQVVKIETMIRDVTKAALARFDKSQKAVQEAAIII